MVNLMDPMTAESRARRCYRIRL